VGNVSKTEHTHLNPEQRRQLCPLVEALATCPSLGSGFNFIGLMGNVNVVLMKQPVS
jgi:hypothetical protein